MEENLEVFGARVHNLKNIDLVIPRNKLVVFTGLSGSGKSSLAFDTIYAEGQRRYMETFSAYARQFIGNLERPDVDKIKRPQPGDLHRTEIAPPGIPGQPSEPSRRSMISCVFSLPGLLMPIPM